MKTHPVRDLVVLMRYLDGESGKRERMRINAHLVSCAECAGEVGAYRALESSIAELPPRRVPAGLSSRILMSVEAERRLRVRSRRHWVEWAGAAYGVSAVAILVALGMSPWRENLLQAFRAFGSGLVSGGVGACATSGCATRSDRARARRVRRGMVIRILRSVCRKCIPTIGRHLASA